MSPQTTNNASDLYRQSTMLYDLFKKSSNSPVCALYEAQKPINIFSNQCTLLYHIYNTYKNMHEMSGIKVTIIYVGEFNIVLQHCILCPVLHSMHYIYLNKYATLYQQKYSLLLLPVFL